MSDRHIVIVTGGRDYSEMFRPLIDHRLNTLRTRHGDFILYHGACQPPGRDEMTGVDRYADDWGQPKLGIDVRQRPADWDQWGRRAGPIRNDQMVREVAGLVPPEQIHGLAFPDMHSPGTWNCIRAMKARGIEVDIWTIGLARAWLTNHGAY